MNQYIASVDVGTTGTRCALIDLGGKIVASEYCEYGAVYLKPGWVEQDADEMIATAMQACKATVAKSGIRPEQVAAVGFSTQRSVTVPVYKDGSKVRLALSWQDSRTGAEVADMLKLIDAEEYYQISGMPMGTTCNITKMLWMRKNEPELYKKTHKFVQLQDAVLFAFGADEFYTDMGDMAFYGIWDVGKLEWSQKLCNLFDVAPELFGKPTAAGRQVAAVTATRRRKDRLCGRHTHLRGRGRPKLRRGRHGFCQERHCHGFAWHGRPGDGVAGQAHSGVWRLDGHQPRGPRDVGDGGAFQRGGRRLPLVP